MARPALTTQVHSANVLSVKKLLEVIAQHNAGIVDDHAATAKMDLDSGITSTTYEAALTAVEIGTAGYVTTEASPSKSPTGVWPADSMSDALFTDVIAQVAARQADRAAVAVLLDADAGITATHFGKSNKLTAAITKAFSITGLEASTVTSIIQLADGRLMAATNEANTANVSNILVSVDGGFSWKSLVTLDGAVDSLMQNPITGSLIAAVNPATGDMQVWRSKDFGGSWVLIHDGDDTGSAFETYASSLASFATSHGVLFIGGITDGPIFRSTDDGDTWAKTLLTDLDSVYQFLETVAGTLIVVGGDGTTGSLWRSTDQGLTWPVEEDAPTNPNMFRAIVQTSTGKLIAVGEADAGKPDSRVSTDDGLTWAAVEIGTFAITQDVVGIAANGLDVYYANVENDWVVSENDGVAFHAVTGNFAAALAGGLGGLLKTVEGGRVVCALNHGTEGGLGLIEGGHGSKLVDNLFSRDHRPQAEQLQYLTDQMNNLTQSWANLGNQLDDDTDVNTTTYEAGLTALLIQERRQSVQPKEFVGRTNFG